MNNIRIIRKALKMSPSEFANAVGCSVPHVYALEKDNVCLDESWLARLSTCFKCTKEQILKENLTNEEIHEIQSNYYKNYYNNCCRNDCLVEEKKYLKNLHKIRTEAIINGKKVSQEDLAKLLNLTKSAVSLLERSELPAKPIYIEKLAKYFGVRQEDLYCDEYLLNNNENLLSEDIKNNNYSVMSSKPRSNNIRAIRKILRIKPDELATLLKCSVTQIYALETEKVTIDEDWKLKLSDVFKCDKELIKKENLSDTDLENIKNNYLNHVVCNNSIINSNQSKCNDARKIDTINIAYYNNIIDLVNNQHATTLQYNVEQLQVFINSAATDHSAIKICKNKNETLLINTLISRATDEPCVFVVKNELKENTTAFIATINIDMLTGKTLMKLENGIETVMPSTCKIIGRVISKIVSV